MPSGGLSIDGPPTTLSGTGVDGMAFLQANITRDNTKFVNGAVILTDVFSRYADMYPYVSEIKKKSLSYC
jgi:hypothetical protein